LQDLLINRHIFHQFRDSISDYVGSDRGAGLASWMAQNYVAFATTTIRRMIEPPKKNLRSISLVILLKDLAAHDSILTRQQFRTMYKNSQAMQMAVRDFDEITRCETATQMTAVIINQDISSLQSASKDIKEFVNKAVAHTEENRQKVPAVQYCKIDEAINLLEKTFGRYCLLLNGHCADPIVPLDGFDVVDDLKRIWPESGRR